MNWYWRLYIIKVIFCSSLLLLPAMSYSSENADIDALINGKLKGQNYQNEFIKFSRELKKAGMSRKKLYEVYKNYINKIGTKKISEHLEKVDPACHGVSHTLGKVIGERIPELNTSMNICGSTCTYGCLHGVFKVYFSRLGKDYHKHEDMKMHKMQKPAKKVVFTQTELARFSKDVNSACNKSNSVVEGFYQGNCAHGVGHAMAQLAGDAKLANIYCAVFPKMFLQYYCETGVFMELAAKIQKEIYPTNLKRSEKVSKALSYCKKASLYPSACLRFLLPHNRSLGQITRYAGLCAKEKGVIRQHCFNALGYHSRTYIAKNLEEIQYSCLLGDEKDQSACISGISLMKKGQRFKPDIEKACALIENKKLQQLCTEQSNKYYYHPENQYFNTFLQVRK